MPELTGRPPTSTVVDVAGRWQLSIGDEAACRGLGRSLATLHACKHPCFVDEAKVWVEKGVAGPEYFTKTGPFYLGFGDDDALFLNLIDPPVPLFQLQSFVTAMDWLDQAVPRRPTLVHCNVGASRAPSLVLLWLARQKELPRDSYEHAASEFRGRFGFGVDGGGYRPGAGIALFLAQHWRTLVPLPA